MDDTRFAEIATWINQAGLGGQDEAAIVTEFCARIVTLGLSLARGQVFIDTLHPVYGGRGYYWQAAKGETIATEYRPAIEGELLERWRRSAFYHMIETGSATLRRRLTSKSGAEFPFLGEFHAAGMTDYFAVIDRFGADTIIGEMDGVYSSWVSDTPQGFTEDHIATLRLRLVSRSPSSRQRWAHRQDFGRNISRTRPRPEGAGRKYYTREINVHPSSSLVQRPAWLHRHLRSSAAERDHPFSQRLCRDGDLGHSWRGRRRCKMVPPRVSFASFVSITSYDQVPRGLCVSTRRSTSGLPNHRPLRRAA